MSEFVVRVAAAMWSADENWKSFIADRRQVEWSSADYQEQLRLCRMARAAIKEITGQEPD